MAGIRNKRLHVHTRRLHARLQEARCGGHVLAIKELYGCRFKGEHLQPPTLPPPLPPNYCPQ
jgi:hypothetical protein